LFLSNIDLDNTANSSQQTTTTTTTEREAGIINDERVLEERRIKYGSSTLKSIRQNVGESVKLFYFRNVKLFNEYTFKVMEEEILLFLYTINQQ
jgi:hypothetical protein